MPKQAQKLHLLTFCDSKGMARSEETVQEMDEINKPIAPILTCGVGSCPHLLYLEWSLFNDFIHI
jgi:hypothetical protein